VTTAIAYDGWNHLVGGTMQATYDGLGRCVRRTTPGGTLLFGYDG
jgi:YD repeat-containing protein